MINRETFKKVINALQEYQQKELVLYRQGLDLGEFNDCLIGAIFNLLKEATNDETELISYFCYEINFGKDWCEGCVTDEDGNDIRLQDIDDLYNILLNDEAKRNPSL